MCWANLGLAELSLEQLKRSAQGGYALAIALCSVKRCVVDHLEMLEEAVALGEPEAMTMRAYYLWNGLYTKHDSQRACLLWREAAELGDANAQYSLARNCCVFGSLERLEWLRRAFVKTACIAVQWTSCWRTL